LSLLALPFEPRWVESAIDWAVDALVEGRDSPSLRMLAGLNPRFDREDAPDLFEAAVRELGVAPLRDPWEAYALWVVERLLDGKMSVEDALAEAFCLDTYNYDGPLGHLASLWWVLDDPHVDARTSAFAEAERVRASLGGSVPSKGPFR